MSLTLITQPAVEPISLFEAKQQVGLSPYDDADPERSDQVAKQLRRYILTARVECENRTKRALITQKWRWVQDGWPARNCKYNWNGIPAFALPLGALQQVTSFAYVDISGNLQNVIDPVLAEGQTQPGSNLADNFTAPPWGCQIVPSGDDVPAYIVPPYATPWPPLQSVPASVALEFICGYGDSGDDVPAPITQAMIFLVDSYYDPTKYKNIDGLVDSLLAPYVNRIS